MEKSNKLLSYASMKSVIQYLEPNLRFCLKFLKLDSTYIKVNETEYGLQLYYRYPPMTNNNIAEEHAIDVVDGDASEILVDLRAAEINRTTPVMLLNLLHVFEPRVFHITFTVRTSSKNQRRAEELSYDKKVHEAVKYLIEKLIGGRGLIKVRTLHFGCFEILRLPSSLKLRTNDLELESYYNYQLFDAIKSTLDLSTSPLNSISLYRDPNLKSEDPIVQSTAILNFRDFYFADEGIHKLSKIRHKLVCVYTGIHNPQEVVQNVTLLIDDWIEIGRDVGYFWSILMPQRAARDILETVKKNHAERIDDGEKVDPDNVIVHVNNTSDLHLVCVRYGFRDELELKVQQRSFY